MYGILNMYTFIISKDCIVTNPFYILRIDTRIIQSPKIPV